MKKNIYKLKKYSKNNIYKNNLSILSNLFCKSTPEYCLLFKYLKCSIKDFFKNIVNVSGTELENFTTIETRNKIIGFCSSYPSLQMKDRQLKTILIMRNLLIKKKKFLFTKKILNNINKLPILSKKTYYISRISILSKYQGKGVGQMLLKEISKNIGKLKKISLHVKLTNKKAVRFYTKCGFKIKITKNNYALCEKIIKT